MTAPVLESPVDGPVKRIARWSVRVTLWGIAALLLLVMVPWRALPHLLFGWVDFLRRVVPEISVRSEILALIFAGIVVLAGGAHWFCRLLATSMQPVLNPGQPVVAWPWRWTCCGLALVLVSTLASMALLGAVHQTGWLLSQQNSWYEPRGKPHEFHFVELIFREQLMDSTDPREFMERFQKQDEDNEIAELRKARTGFHLLLLLNGDQKMSGILIIPRDTTKRTAWGAIMWEDDKRVSLSAQKLAAFMAGNRHRLLAL